MKSEGASSPVERALWFIESRLGEEISLESIAKSVDVTDHHLARAFGAVQDNPSCDMFVAAASRKQPDPWQLASLTFLRLPSKLAMAHMRRLRERFENNFRSHLETFVWRQP